MYRALKTVECEVKEALLKFTDELVDIQGRQTAIEPAKDGAQVEALNTSLQMLHAKQDAQFRVLNSSLEHLCTTMSEVASLLKRVVSDDSSESQNSVHPAVAVTVEKMIPSLQPVGDLNTVLRTNTPVESDGEGEEEVEEEVAVEEEVEEEEEVEVEEEAEEEPEPVKPSKPAPAPEPESEEVEEDDAEEEEVEVEEDEEEEGVEVEEWTYKGRQYFKDTDNVVYANDNGECGDPLGRYNPKTNKVEKLE